jgi:hypothetical protein
MSSTAVVGDRRSSHGPTDTSDVDNFAGRGEGAAGLKLEQSQKRNKTLRDWEAPACNLLQEERTVLRALNKETRDCGLEQMALTNLMEAETRIQTRREMVTGKKPDLCKACKPRMLDDKRKKETKKPDTAEQEAASREKDREDLAQWNLSHFNTEHHHQASRTTKIIHDLFSEVLLSLIVLSPLLYVTIRILVTLNSD